MALHKLLVDDFYDHTYKLIAIHCGLEDYRLAYLLNKNLGINLKRKEEDLDFGYLKSTYSLFEWNNETEYVLWNLVSNVCKREEDNFYTPDTLFKKSDKVIKTFNLIPDYSRVDYFIKISDELQNINEKFILQCLKKIPQIVTSYTVDPLQIKSKDYLIF